MEAPGAQVLLSQGPCGGLEAWDGGRGARVPLPKGRHGGLWAEGECLGGGVCEGGAACSQQNVEAPQLQGLTRSVRWGLRKGCSLQPLSCGCSKLQGH